MSSRASSTSPRDVIAERARKRDIIFPSGGTQVTMKVAIPRQQSVVAPQFNRRVPRACESCRQRKTKCNGHTPTCQNCKELKITCFYPLHVREKRKKEMGSLSEKVKDYETMLKQMENLVHGQYAERVKGLLHKYESGLGHRSNGNENSRHTSQSQPTTERSSSPSSIGSLEAVDRVEDDLNLTESSRATGYMGKSSELSWMQRVQEEAEQQNRGEPAKGTSGENYSENVRIAPHTINYHIDDLGIDAPGPVQMYWVPPRPLADHLFETYLLRVHPHFPIINRTMFSAEYRNFFSQMPYADDKWLAILNMIFAIASNCSHNCDLAQPGETTDHLFYLARARMLSMSGDNIFQPPDLQQVQIEGLIAFHMLSINQINRAWRISGLATRSAVSLGINKRNSASNMPDLAKELRYRIWWCLYAVDHALNSMTGRGASISIHMCTSPLPLPFDENQFSDPLATLLLTNHEIRDKRLDMAMTGPHLRYPDVPQAEATQPERSWLQSLPVNNSLYFLYYCDLTIVNQEILDQVYSAENATMSWEYIKKSIGKLNSSIDKWKETLPPGLDFSSFEDENDQAYWVKLNLAFHYHSTRIILGRPCLCRHRTHGNSSTEKGFSHSMAVMTVESAMHMLALLPDEPNTVHVYKYCPWWCFLHYIVQTATVIILEISFRCFHMPDQEKSVVESAKKSVRWLYTMSESCVASRRAWQLCENALRQLVSSMGYDASDVAHPKQQPDDQFNDPASVMSPAHVPMTVDGAPSLPHYDRSVSSNPPSEIYATNQYNNNLDFMDSSSSAFLPAPTTQGLTAADTYFPYDPISGELIRYFFPSLDEEESPHSLDLPA